MLEFYKFVPQFGMRDASPFCLKLMTYLNLAEVPHKTIELMDPRKGPKEKLPYIVDKGEAIGDTEFTIRYLKQTYGNPLGQGLTERERALSHALNVMFAERFYWASAVYPRWVRKENRELITETWFGMIPKPLRGFITRPIFKEMESTVKGHGIGRHTAEEIYALGLSDLKAVEAQLGDQDFLLGDTVREIDATAYAFLANASCEVFPTPLCQYVRNSTKLMAYIDRVDKRAFG
ncbi:MAG: glutathione S-transferase family protein [Litorimonas sp.]